MLFALLNLPDGDAQELHRALRPTVGRFRGSASARKAPARTWNPRRLAVRLGSGGAAVQDGEGLVVLDARNLALLLRQEGRGRVLFAGHSVPQGGTASGDAERI